VPFCRINGVVAKVSDGGSAREIGFRGDIARGSAGNLVDGRRQARRTYKLQLSHLPIEEARSLSLLTIGFAHVFNFNGGINSSTSIAPTVAGHGAHLDIGGGWDGDAIVVRSGVSVSFDAQLDDEWTTLLRFRDATAAGSPWRYGARTSDGREWLDGVEGVVGLDNPLRISAAGVVSLFGFTKAGGAADLTCDELVVLPFRMADAHIRDALSWEQPWGASPEVHLQGDLLESPLGIFAAGTSQAANVVTRGTGRTLRGGLTGPRPRAPFPIDDDFLNNAMEQEAELVETTRHASVESLPLPSMYVPEGIANTFLLNVFELVASLNLTDVGGPQAFITGPDGYLNSATSYLGTANDRAARAGATASANGPAGLLTVCGWLLPTSAITQTIWSKWSEGIGGREWRVSQLATGQVSVQVSNGAGTLSETYTTVQSFLSVGSWAFISFDFSAARPALSRVRMFVNGSPVPSTTVAVGAFVGMDVTTGVLNVPGQDNPIAGMSGGIAHWTVWSGRALLTEQQRIAYLLTKRGHLLRRA